jgi:hypothetical protein
MSKKEITKLLKKRISTIDNASLKFISKVDKTQKEILKVALELVGELDTQGGRILTTKNNLKLIAEIEANLKKAFSKSDYIDGVDELIKDLDTTKAITESYFSAEFGKFTKANANAVYAAKRKETVELLMGTSAIDQNFFKPIAATLVDSVVSQSTYKELITNIKTTVTGNSAVDGKLHRYARQIASDTFSTTERAYTKTLGQDIGAVFYRYLGGLLDTTRCFCEQRNGNYYHVAEIGAWGSGDTGVSVDEDCGFPWAGMYIGTNESTIFTWLGGYNCRHSIIPVSIFSVPREVIIRAIENNYLKLTESERILLNL